MDPGYPDVPGGPWGKDRTINQTGKAVIFLHDIIPGNLIGRYLPARPSFLRGQVTLAHPADPEDDGSEEWWRKWKTRCDMYVRERATPRRKWAKDEVSQYRREETANWRVPSPIGTVYISFCPLLYTSVSLQGGDLHLWGWFPEAERCLLGPAGWWIEFFIPSSPQVKLIFKCFFPLLYPFLPYRVTDSGARLTKAADFSK